MVRWSGFLLAALMVCLALLSPEAGAIDSLPELLKKAAKAEKKRVDEVKKQGSPTVLTLTSVADSGAREEVSCVWVAKVGDEFRLMNAKTGNLQRIEAKDVLAVRGVVLSETPTSEVVVHAMHCNGGYCKPTIKTIVVPAWPVNQ